MKSNKNDRDQLLSRSILLEEVASPATQKIVVYFTFVATILFVSWAWIFEIDEISVATGTIMPVGEIHRIQHIDGGVVEKIDIKDGQLINENQSLLIFNTKLLHLEREKLMTSLSSLNKRFSFLREQVLIKEQLLEKGLVSKMSFLSTKVQLSEIEGKVDEATDQLKQIDEKISRSTIYSPVAGRIHNLKVNYRGEVVGPGDLICEIVPTNLPLSAEIRISTQDIGHISPGQSVLLKFTNYDFSRFGGVTAILKEISPSTFVDDKGIPYYRGIVNLKQNHIRFKSNDYPILPGMVLMANIKTGSKSVLQYLLKPVYTSASSALTER